MGTSAAVNSGSVGGDGDSGESNALIFEVVVVVFVGGGSGVDDGINVGYVGDSWELMLSLLV